MLEKLIHQVKLSLAKSNRALHNESGSNPKLAWKLCPLQSFQAPRPHPGHSANILGQWTLSSASKAISLSQGAQQRKTQRRVVWNTWKLCHKEGSGSWHICLHLIWPEHSHCCRLMWVPQNLYVQVLILCTSR